MAATLTSTGITFSDGTSLNSAAPSFGSVGTYAWMLPIQSVSYSGTSGSSMLVNLSAGTTIAGSSLGYNVINNAVNGYNLTSAGASSFSIGAANMYVSATAIGVTNYNITTIGIPTCTAATGSWRSMSGCSISASASSTKIGYLRTFVRNTGLFLRYA